MAVGIDFSQIAIKQARLNFKNSENNCIHFGVTDFCSLGLKSNSAKAAVSIDALYLAQNREMVLSELHRVLVPGGRLIFTFFVRGNDSDADFEVASWKYSIYAAGFKILRQKNVSREWRAGMRKKHRYRWDNRIRIRKESGNSCEEELAISANAVGLRGRSFIDEVARYEMILSSG